MPSRRTKPARSSGNSGGYWIAALVVVAGVVAYGAYYLFNVSKSHETDSATGCLTGKRPPKAAMFLIDTTDRLSPENARYVIETIKREEADLPRFSRVILVPFGDDTATPLSPIFNKCLPGRAEEAGIDENARFLRAAAEEFDRSLEALQEKLQGIESSRTSPITEQVVRAASSPVLDWQGDARRLVLISDGLESSIYWSRDLQLADPKPGMLAGVEAEYVELGNAKGARLQTDEMRERWKSWFAKAGATVRMTAPGYVATSD
jgi:hypothetical protein